GVRDAAASQREQDRFLPYPMSGAHPADDQAFLNQYAECVARRGLPDAVLPGDLVARRDRRPRRERAVDDLAANVLDYAQVDRIGVGHKSIPEADESSPILAYSTGTPE